MARKKTSFKPYNKVTPKSAKPVTVQTQSKKTGQSANTNSKSIFGNFSVSDFFSCLVILFYINVTRVGPREAFDVSTSRWQYLAMVNIGILIYILILKYLKGDETKTKLNIYSNNVFYSFIVMVAIASTTILHATNFGEAMINFGRLSAVFIVFVNIAYILQNRFHLIHFITKALIAYLLFDMVVYYIIHLKDFLLLDFAKASNVGFSTDNIKGILNDPKDPANPWHGGYANRNILSAAIVLKIPFSIYGFMFYKRFWRILSVIAFVSSSMAIVFLGTRSIILSEILMILSSILGILYMIKIKIFNKKFLYYILLMIAPILCAFPIQTFYSNKQINYTLSVHAENNRKHILEQYEQYKTEVGNYKFDNPTTDRFKNLVDNFINQEGSFGNRIKAAKRSWKLFKENPILGVGIGNWKVDILKYESRDAAQFVLMKHAHDDFIEYGVELGIFGLLAFIGIFFFTILNVIRILRSNLSPNIKTLSLFGGIALITYVPDAVSNFPSERTELQIFLAFILGINCALYFYYQKMNPNIKVRFSLPVKYLHWVLLVVGCIFYYFSNSMFESSKHQRLSFADYNSIHVKRDQYKYKNYFKKNTFPKYPSMDEICTPISVIKALYKINDKDYQGAIDILKKDNENPYHMRKEYLLADSYNELNQPDSALKYAKIVFKYKPLLQDNIVLLNRLFLNKNQIDSSIYYIKKYLDLEKNTPNPWALLINNFLRKGQRDSASFYVDSALKLFPNNQTFVRQKFGYYTQLGNQAMREKKYAEAIKNYNIILEQNTEILDVLQNRAFAYYSSKDYLNAIKDFSTLLEKRPNEAIYLFHRGLCYYFLRRNKDACDDFTRGAGLGHKESIQNMNFVCNQQ